LEKWLLFWGERYNSLSSVELNQKYRKEMEKLCRATAT